MEQNMQQICNEMDNKANEFIDFQSKYYTNKADDLALMERTTQPFWQSMRLSKRRLASKGLSMDVKLSQDKKSKTIKDERLHMHKDGHHLVGNKTTNVISYRTFYKDSKKLTSVKDRAICNLALLKTEVNGNQAACPNCGYVSTITSFIDGCDACNSKFTVQDFETKVSGFSLEENTSAKIKDTIIRNARFLGLLVAAFILLGIITLVLMVMRLITGVEGANFISLLLIFSESFSMVPVTIKSLIVLAIVYIAGASYLISIYKKPILQEDIVKQVLPDFSARDFYQNLEYKLRNIHLTDRAEEVNVFARCALNNIITDYKNVVDCDVTRLKFISIQADSAEYRVNVETELRLTEYDTKRISTNYEKLQLTLSGKPESINKSVTTLRQYTCPGCGSSINILEGGKCSYCGNTFDYSQFGWVIERYESKRQSVSLYQSIKYIMIGLFVIIFGGHILFPAGITNANILEMRRAFSDQLEAVEKIYAQIEKPDALYDDVTLISNQNFVLEEISKYKATNASSIVEQYRAYLDSHELQFYKNIENGFIVYETIELNEKYETTLYYYRITVTYDNDTISVEEEVVQNLDDVADYSVKLD